MGIFDEMIGDLKAIGEELAETRKVVKKSLNEFTDDVTGIKKDVRETIDGVKGKAVQTKQEVREAFSIKPDETDKEKITNHTDEAEDKEIDSDKKIHETV